MQSIISKWQDVEHTNHTSAVLGEYGFFCMGGQGAVGAKGGG